MEKIFVFLLRLLKWQSMIDGDETKWVKWERNPTAYHPLARDQGGGEDPQID